MTIGELLGELGARQIRLRRNREELILVGSVQALEPSLVTHVRAHKASLLELIGNEPSTELTPGAIITPDMVTLMQLSQEEIDAIIERVPGGAPNVQDIYPLAPLQEGILFHHLMTVKGDPYLLAMLMRFETRDRLDQYLGAVQRVIDRHDILRTAILWQGLREPVQVVWRKAPVVVEEIEIDEHADAAGQLYERFDPRRHRIDVRHAPMLRMYLARDRQNGGWLLMRVQHHLIGDHSTMELMQEEIAAYLLGRGRDLPEPEPFRNLVAQARLGVSTQEHEAFFRSLLGDVEEPTAPFGLMTALEDGTGIEEATLELEQDLTCRIRERARTMRVSAAIVFHLAWACVVARTAGRDEAVFGTVLFGQMQRGGSTHRAMGLFINTLPMRIRLAVDSVEAALQKTQRALADLMRHEHASLVLAQRSSGVPTPAPLFTSILNYRHIRLAGHTPDITSAWDGIEVLRGGERTNYPVSLSVNDFGESASLTAQTDASIDPMRVCEYMRAALESIVEALESAPRKPARAINVLSPNERARVLFEWNASGWEFPRDKCVHELFEAQVERTPEAVAVVYEGGQLSYGELNGRANRLARYLQLLGVKPETRVAVCAQRGFEAILALLAIWKAGGVYVPLDPAYPAERLSRMLDDSAPAVVLAQSRLRPVIGASPSAEVVDLDQDAPWRELSASNIETGSMGVGRQHLAYIIYTSGSTGAPKGVMVEHGGIPNLALAQIDRFRLESVSRVLQFASFNFDASISEVVMALLSGACLCIPRSGEILAGEKLATLLADHRITHVTLPPAVLATLPEECALPALRVLIVAGEAISDGLASRWVEGRQLINAYGPTETTVWAAGHDCRRGEGRPPIGRPAPNARIYILDRDGEVSPLGVAGEICIGGVGLARGYWNRPELTAQRFVPDPHAASPGARIYRTGDLGRWLPAAEIDFLGRNDFQVKIRGVRIELGEIETRLAKYSAVRDAVVILQERTPGDKRLVAYYTAAGPADDSAAAASEDSGSAAALQPASLRAHLAAVLPEYMLPAAYVRLERLPFTANGKLDRKALLEADGSPCLSREYEPPEGTVETILAAIWAELLGLERVGRRDNFFELGGHSLLAVRAISRIQQQFKLEAAVKDLFTYPELHSFAALLALPRQHAEHAIPIREKGSEPPVFFTHGADDEAAYAWALAPYIDARMPIYELPAQQHGGARLRTIEGQARRMIGMIRAVQPRGPYRIAGFCFGSFLAYEIARQLIGADEAVFLALLDFRVAFGNSDDEPLITSAPVTPDLRINFLSAISDHAAVMHLPDSVQTTLAEWKRTSQTLEELFYRCKERGWVPEPWILLTPSRLERLLAHLADMERNPYFFAVLPIDVHMFIAQDEPSAAGLPDHFRALIPGVQMKSIPAPGTHNTMVQSPNVKRLGPLLAEAIAEDSRKEASAASRASLVLLTRWALPARGEGPPLFCVPGSGLSAASFNDVATACAAPRPVYAFQARGLADAGIPHTSVEAAAPFYLRELTTAWPDGPVHLAGHLRGGWIAFEMALMLQAAGRAVLSLTLLDTDPPSAGASGATPEYTVSDAVAHWLKRIELATPRVVTGLADLQREDPASQREILRELLVQSGFLPHGSGTQDVYRLLRTLGAGLATTYLPREAYPGTIHLVTTQADGSDESAQPDARADWSRWCGGTVEHDFAGNAMTVLKSPHAAALAGMFDELMQRSERHAPSASRD